MDLSIESGFVPATPSEVVESAELLENLSILKIENGAAWHGGTAKAWLNTDQALQLDPVCRMILEGIEGIAAYKQIDWHENEALAEAFRAVTEGWVSDARWPPAPTSPGRFNVREALEALYRANDRVAGAMEELGIAGLRSLYSPDIMSSQLGLIEERLMEMRYFEEE